MSLIAFFLIFSSILLHALWHFLCKANRPDLGFFPLFSFALWLTMLPFLLLSGINPGNLGLKAWLCIAGGGLCGMIGDLGLSVAYSREDISKAYPISRAIPVLLTAFLTGILGIGSRQSPVTICGMVLIFAGCILMPLSNLKEIRFRSYFTKGMAGIYLAGVATTLYTVIDSIGIREITNGNPEVRRIFSAGTYSALREMFAWPILSIIVLLKKSERVKMNRERFLHPQPYCAGVFAGLAYLLVLLSMGFVTNVSYVQAFRQMSLPVGLLLGILILKEKASMTKIAGVVLILAGLLAVTLGADC